jgi:hypothetical protein
MINKYIIYSQYEYYSKNGIELTEWFPIGYKYNSLKEAEDALSKIKEISKYVDKKTKLKHFFNIKCIDITTLPIPTYPVKSKGRKSKKYLKDEEDYYKNYWKRYE